MSGRAPCNFSDRVIHMLDFSGHSTRVLDVWTTCPIGQARPSILVLSTTARYDLILYRVVDLNAACDSAKAQPPRSLNRAFLARADLPIPQLTICTVALKLIWLLQHSAFSQHVFSFQFISGRHKQRKAWSWVLRPAALVQFHPSSSAATSTLCAAAY